MSAQAQGSATSSSKRNAMMRDFSLGCQIRERAAVAELLIQRIFEK
jgi:hypothetical protein